MAKAKKKKKKPKEFDFRNLIQAQLCRVLNKKTNRINEWRKKEGFPSGIRNGKTTYDAGDILDWLVNHRVQQLKKQMQGATKDEITINKKKIESEAKIKYEDARKRKRLNDIAEGKLVTISDARQALATIAQIIKTKLEAKGRMNQNIKHQDIIIMLEDAQNDFNGKFKTGKMVQDGLFSDKKEQDK